MNSGYSEPPDILNFLPGPFELTLTRESTVFHFCTVKEKEIFAGILKNIS